MAEYRAPLRDMRFVLHEVMRAEQLWQSMPGLNEVNAELADAVLEEAGKITSGLIAPLNRPGDEQGVRLENGQVITPEGYREAFTRFAEGGWLGLSGNPEFEGQGMPKMLTVLFEEMLHAAGNSFALYAILTSGAALCLNAHASETLKRRFLPSLYTGRWAGAMCLTESHAGSDLGLIRTKAQPLGGERYALTGTKIFITGGDHDLTENIIHLVLAKLPDAPPGSKGISMFLVPKFKVDEQGALGERNGVHCAALESKMGIHASSTCVLNFDGAEGFLIGEPHRGLAAMFTMMNYERLSVGLQGLGSAELAYQKSLNYARERLQGRAPGGAVNREADADPLLVHPDVRRMLLTQKALVEGGRAFAAYCGMQLDAARYGEGAARESAEAMVALLTPVAKAFMTDQGLDGCVLGQQVFGGHGYVREWGMEQLVRDVRISQIYEGTNGIQAMDLVGRKVIANGGRSVAALLTEMRQFGAETGSTPGMDEFLQPLTVAVDTLEVLTETLLSQADADPNAAGAAAVDYLHALGWTVYAYMWARMVRVALPEAASGGRGFYAAKLHTARFFMHRLLPRLQAHAAAVRAGSAPLMALEDGDFAF